MIQQRHRARAAIYLAGDLLATVLALLAAWVVRFETGLIPVPKGVPEFRYYAFFLAATLLLWPVVFYFHGLYQIRRGRSRIDEVLTLTVAVLLGAVILSGVSSWVRIPLDRAENDYFFYSRLFIGLFVVLDLLFLVGTRQAIRRAFHRRQLRGLNQQRILVVGAGRLGTEIAAKLRGHRELGLEVVGFLDDDPAKRDQEIVGVPVLGGIDDLEAVISSRQIDQVYIALPLEAHKKMLAALSRVGKEYVEVKIVPDVVQYATLKATLEDLDGTPVINLSQVPLQGWSSLVKRGMDLTLATLGLLVVTPFLPLVALAIWLEDRGPIFYRQERMGLDGQRFQIWKLRSMRVDAESSIGPVWAVREDGRRTRVGSFLRRWSLDELPQLWNVIKGEMSLVGPRPERPTFVHEFRDRIPQYIHRHRVKAGITGWAQVHGWRGNTSIRKRIQYDLYYIENWSLKLDLKILWMTLRGFRRNAY